MFSHTHSPDGLNDTLLFKAASLKQLLGWEWWVEGPWTGKGWGISDCLGPAQSPGRHARSMPASNSLTYTLFHSTYLRLWVHWDVGLVAKLCPTLVTPWDCNPPGSSVHEILQARILEWVGIPFSRGSSWPRDWTHVSCITGQFFFFYQLSHQGSLTRVGSIIEFYWKKKLDPWG